jgi:pilus assembly protein CpaF
MQHELIDDLRAAAVANVGLALVDVINEQRLLTDTSTLQGLVAEVDQELHGLGPLATFVQPGVTDILVNGNREVWIDDATGLHKSTLVFHDEPAVRRLAVRLAASAGRRLDDASPWVDARLPNGMRLHAVLHPLSRDGSSISLRLPSNSPFTLRELEQRRMFSAQVRRQLQSLVASGEPFLVSGGTGTGKTTLLAAMLSEVPATQRIVIVEDSAELRVEHPHAVYLEGRPPNVEGAGAVTLRELVRQSLRMRPDRLIVGEVRGTEVLDLLNALNTGHSGGAATVHANSAADAGLRLELLAMQAGLAREAATAAIQSAFRTVIHLSRVNGKRVVSEIRRD